MSQRDAEKWDAAEEGAELLREGEVEAAIRALEQVIEHDPDNEYAYFFLGSAHFERQRFDKAMKAYVEALRIAPKYLGAMASLGHTLRMLGRHEEAIRLARQILAISANDTDALYLLGLSHYARGERAAAVQYLEKFLQAGPEVEVANEVTGLLQILRGDVEPAEPTPGGGPDRSLN
jgi:cytochrome c-type biogenesis protein CcmH/NrfG